MKKIAEFKQEQFVYKTDETYVHNYESPTYCELYKVKQGFMLIKFINEAEVVLYEHYNEAYKAFTDFVYIQLSNE